MCVLCVCVYSSVFHSTCVGSYVPVVMSDSRVSPKTPRPLGGAQCLYIPDCSSMVPDHVLLSVSVCLRVKSDG